MKKILLIHHSGGIGGAGVSLYNTVVALSKEFEVTIYCPAEPDLYYKFLIEKNVNVKTYDFPLGSIPYYSGGTNIFSPSFMKSIINIKRYLEEWEKILKTEIPDLVIVNSRILSWFSILTNKLQINSICFVRETREKSIFNIMNSIQKALLDKFSAVVFISKYDKNVEKLRKTKSIVIPNFIDTEKYILRNDPLNLCNAYGISQSKFNILFVGGMLRIKGFDVAVKALKYLKNYNVCLVVAGDPEFKYKKSQGVTSIIYNLFKRRYETNIHSTIKKYALDKLIIKVGIQSDMPSLYTLADVLIFPANEPHQARPAFEAGALKKPVIMPDFKNTKEYIRDGVNGLVFRHRSPKSLADKIIMLIENEKLRVKLGEENYQQTMKHHTKKDSEKLLLEIVKEFISI